MGIFESVVKGFKEAGKLMHVIIIFFAFNVVVGLISLPLADPAGAQNPGVAALSIVASLVFFLFFILLQGGALALVRDKIKTSVVDMGKFLNYGKEYYLRILLLLLAYMIMAIGIVIVLSLISAGILLMGDNIITRTLVAAIVTIAAVSVITLLVYPIYAIVAENIGVVEALKKGVGVAKANFLKTMGLFIVLLIISMTVSVSVGFIAGFISVPMPQILGQIIITIANAAVQSYMPVVMMAAFMGLYLALSGGSSSETVVSTPQDNYGA